MRDCLAARRFLIAGTLGVVGLALLASIAAADETGAAREGQSPSKDQSPSSGSPAAYRGAEVALINRHVRQGWTDHGLTPSKAATDGEWCRRVHLDLIGRIPSVAELEAFERNKSPDKKAELIARLLGDEYVEDVARNWTTIWTNVLIGRTGGGNMTSRAGMQQYLRRAFQRGKPYDEMAVELITATGTTAPGSENYNGATNFLVGKMEDKAVQATAKTAQIFLGLQVQCTQCHNHPFNDWKQNQFWELNAFFRQARPLRSFEGRQIAGVNLVDESWPGEGGDPAEAELYYELRNGLVKVAYPVFVDGTSLADILGEKAGNSGYLEDVNRREELGKLILKAPQFEQAIVNRYWAHFLGYGFTKPVDDLGPHNPPSHAELLVELGKAFRESGFDLKQLISWITLSEPYSLSSRMTKGNKADDPALGVRPMFSHFYIRQMQAEQLYESLLTATRAEQTQGGEAEAAKQRWLNQFAQAFGTDENDEMTTFNGTIPQTLMMMNGEMINKATGADPNGFLGRIAASRMSNTKKIRHLYQAALARRPTRRELGVANGLLAARKGNAVEALQDVWWVLLNSNEFILNH